MFIIFFFFVLLLISCLFLVLLFASIDLINSCVWCVWLAYFCCHMFMFGFVHLFHILMSSAELWWCANKFPWLMWPASTVLQLMWHVMAKLKPVLWHWLYVSAWQNSSLFSDIGWMSVVVSDTLAALSSQNIFLVPF